MAFFILVRFALLACCVLLCLLAFVFTLLAFLFTLLCLLAYFALLRLLGLLCNATVCDAWLGKFHLARLAFSPLGLVWLDMLASWHAFEQNNSWNLSKTAPTLARCKLSMIKQKNRFKQLLSKFWEKTATTINFLKLSMIFEKHAYLVWFWNGLVNPPTSPDF